MDVVNDRIRKMIDNSDNVQGFVVNHSVGGGTGSGLGMLILERLAVDHRKKSKIGFEIVPFFLFLIFFFFVQFFFLVSISKHFYLYCRTLQWFIIHPLVIRSH